MIMKQDKNNINEGMIVELITSLPGRDPGLTGEIKEIESIDYENTAVWIYWNELKKLDRFDLSYEPSILDKIKIKE